ncbi:hypothetical protein [Zavarzinia marina]|nr:hypothetical protein [Zavarzinia marina]
MDVLQALISIDERRDLAFVTIAHIMADDMVSGDMVPGPHES